MGDLLSQRDIELIAEAQAISERKSAKIPSREHVDALLKFVTWTRCEIRRLETLLNVNKSEPEVWNV